MSTIFDMEEFEDIVRGGKFRPEDSVSHAFACHARKALWGLGELEDRHDDENWDIRAFYTCKMPALDIG